VLKEAAAGKTVMGEAIEGESDMGILRKGMGATVGAWAAQSIAGLHALGKAHWPVTGRI